MYSNPTRLPQTTNREDLQFTVSIFDDDTGLPVNLSGITFLQNPNGFTGTNWQVTDGTIVTTSATSFTVPGYPIRNELLAVTLGVVLNLNILAGDPITISDVGGNATMVGYVTSYSATTGVLVVQVGLNFQLIIRSMERQDRGFGHDYSPWYDWGGGGPGGNPPLIAASLGGGLSIIDIGYTQVNIPASIMQRLRLRSYMIAMVMTDSINTRQVFLGELPVLDGGIMQMNMTSLPIATAAPSPTPPPIPPIPPGSQSDNIPAGVP